MKKVLIILVCLLVKSNLMCDFQSCSQGCGNKFQGCPEKINTCNSQCCSNSGGEWNGSSCNHIKN